MSDITQGTQLINEILTGQSLFGSGLEYLITFGLILIVGIAITPRKLGNLKTLAFPLGVGFYLIGMNMPLVFLALLGILFVIDTLSMNTIGNIVEAVGSKTLEGIGRDRTLERIKRGKLRVKKYVQANDLALQGEGVGIFRRKTKQQKELLKRIKNIENRNVQINVDRATKIALKQREKMIPIEEIGNRRTLTYNMKPEGKYSTPLRRDQLKRKMTFKTPGGSVSTPSGIKLTYNMNKIKEKVNPRFMRMKINKGKRRSLYERKFDFFE